MEYEELKLIFNAIEDGRCLAFLGAGACTPFQNHRNETVPGLSVGGELAQYLAQQCDYPNPNGCPLDLLKVAEYFLYKRSGERSSLERALQKKIQLSCPPRPIHTVLAQLHQVQLVITTNYDTLLEDELKRHDRRLRKYVYNRANPTTAHFDTTLDFEAGEVALLKMHGTIDEPWSMVITRSDYITYLANLNNKDEGLPDLFRLMLPQRTLLFLGYSLEDWNFQVIWEGVLSTYANRSLRKDAYALVKNPGPMQKKYWSRRNIDVFDQDLSEFARKLAGHFDLEIPQLGIQKSGGGNSSGGGA